MLTVYSKPRCMQCEMTKIWLTKNKIEFETVDIEANPGAFELIKALWIHITSSSGD